MLGKAYILKHSWDGKLLNFRRKKKKEEVKKLKSKPEIS